jgi:hypothetical protein
MSNFESISSMQNSSLSCLKDVYGPVDESYGQRVLLVLAPGGNLLAFRQAIAR